MSNLKLDLSSIRAPRPVPAPDPGWNPPAGPSDRHPLAPDWERRSPDRVVNCLVLKAHFSGSEWHEIGSYYQAPENAVANLVTAGYLAIDPTSTDAEWFVDATEPEESAGYDGSIGPLIRVRALEMGLVGFPPGFLRFAPALEYNWYVSDVGEEKMVSECIAIELERVGKVKIVGPLPLSPRGERYRESRRLKKKILYY